MDVETEAGVVKLMGIHVDKTKTTSRWVMDTALNFSITADQLLKIEMNFLKKNVVALQWKKISVPHNV